MSVIHINQICQKIKDLFIAELDVSDLNFTDKERENKILTRCLAAYAIYCSIECTTTEAAQSVVDGGDDNGIDAIYYSPANKKMLLVQSKFSKDGSGEPASDGVMKFCRGVKDLFNMTLDRFNDKIKAKRIDIEKALKEYETRYELILIDTCATKELAIHSTRVIEDLLSEMNSTGEDQSEQIISFTRLNQGKVFSSLALSAGSEPISIEIGLTQWGVLSDPYKAYYGMVSGKEIGEWWKSYNTRLFEKNIRLVLGTTDVNEEIEKTLKETPNLFWYFNNGITIIADKIEKSAVGGGSKDIGSFKLTNIAIVNGAQTVSTIGKYLVSLKEENLIDEVKVSIRMIQLSETPENFDKAVTKTNNRQNRIENRDFVSQDPEQIRIKTELSIDGIEYNIMRSETFKESEKSFELNEATAALACASGKTSLAVQVKGGIGKFYENLDKGIYKELFNPSVTGRYVFHCIKVLRAIETMLWEKTEELEKYSGREYGVLVHGNRIATLLTISRLNLKSRLNSSDFELDHSIIKTELYSVVDNMIKFLETNYPESILSVLFKNQTKCAHLTDKLK